MREAAANLEFEEAARLRDEIKRLQATELAVADDPLARAGRVEAEAGQIGAFASSPREADPARRARRDGGRPRRASPSPPSMTWAPAPTGRFPLFAGERPRGRSTQGLAGQRPKFKKR